jgi:adenylate cyclase
MAGPVTRRPTRHRLRLRLILLVCVAVGSAAVALTLRGTDALDSLELDTIDTRFEIRGAREAPRDIVIVALDDRTLTGVDLGRAPMRALQARVLERLRRDRPRLIAYDMQFIGRSSPRADEALVQAISRARPVVLATRNVPQGPPLRVPAGERDPGRLGARLGSVEALNDEDGVVRVMPYFSDPPQAFAVVAAEELLGHPVDQGAFPDGAAWIDFRGPPGTFREYSMSRVVDGDHRPGTFSDKVVLVGATSPDLRDIVMTPSSADPMPGVEVHANSLATILDGFPLSDASAPVAIGLAILLASLAPLVAVRFSAAVAIGAAFLAAAIFAGGAQLAFEGGSILPVTYPLAGLVVGTAGAAAVDLLLETRERRRLHQAFLRFVPEHVVDEALAHTGDDLRLGGETIEATVMFCDLRGFSSFAERHSASTVIQTLNRYLTDMTDAIFEHGGTVVSYMGDGVMGVFGAPVEQPDNAERAFAAGRDMLDRRLPAFNQWLLDRGLGEGFRIGIGLCTGPVTSGNVGSERRLEYAAVGDTTNVAARLQEKNKELGSQLLMAESTRVRLRVADAELVSVGEHQIAGRTGNIKVWGLASPDSAAPHAAEAARNA